MSGLSSSQSTSVQCPSITSAVSTGLLQITKVQALRPFRRHFTNRQIWRNACKRIEAGKRRRRKIISWWKSGKLDGERVPTCLKSVTHNQKTQGGRAYPLHYYMTDLIDKHCRLQVNKVKARSTELRLAQPEVWEQVQAIENDAEFQKAQLDVHFQEMDSNISIPTVPSPLIDKLTNSIFEDPIITPQGQTYERHAIEEHLSQVGSTDPFALTPLEGSDLIPNVAIQDAVEEFVEDNEWAIDFDSNANRFFEYD